MITTHRARGGFVLSRTLRLGGDVERDSSRLHSIPAVRPPEKSFAVFLFLFSRG